MAMQGCIPIQILCIFMFAFPSGQCYSKGDFPAKKSIPKEGEKTMNQKLWRRLCAVLLAAVLTAGSIVSAGACTGLYVGSSASENGSTYVGRSEDIGKLYDKVFEVRPAADHAEGELYEDTYGFSMPYPAHTYRYTVLRDSINAYASTESWLDGDGNLVREAYGEAGVNEKGVAVSATVSTAYNDAVEAVDPVDGGWDGGLCEISLASVILMQADSARDGVEKLTAIIDEYGNGECNSLVICDAEEVWDVELLSGRQYVALRMPADKVSVNPNMVVMNEVDVSDTENVIASENLISLARENGFLVSSQLGTGAEEITKIDIARTYGAGDFGSGQYERFWQGVRYLNEALSGEVSIVYGEGGEAPEGPFPMLFDADRQLSTYEVLRLLAYRGEGTAYDANEGGCYAIGNAYQAECHVFEIRSGMPDALATIQWQAMSRAEFSVYLPFYSSLLTDTSDLYQTEFGIVVDDDYSNYYDIYYGDVSSLMEREDWPEDSIQWVFVALNDLCDQNRDRYGVNVQKFWEAYQKALIRQQADVDKAMQKIYAYSPALAEEKATALGKAVAQEAFGYARSMLDELLVFMNEHANDSEIFMPTVLQEGKLPTYSINLVGGTGIPSSSGSSSTPKYTLTFQTNGGSALSSLSKKSGNVVDLSVYLPIRAGYTFDGWYADSSLTRKVASVTLHADTTVYAKWTALPAQTSFSDVAGSAWYADAVAYVSRQGIMNGKADGTFAPDATLTRGMLVQVLYNLEGRPAASASAFTDVAASAWCADAVSWAAAKQIVLGYGDGTFGPNDTITRQQMAAILYRYAASKGADVSAPAGTLSRFVDADQVASYAVQAFSWAVNSGLMDGKAGGLLDPQGAATRAQTAKILMNYCEKIAK